MNTTNNITKKEESKKEQTVVYTDAMLPELSQEGHRDCRVCTLQVLGTKKTGKRTRRLLQLERGDVSRPR